MTLWIGYARSGKEIEVSVAIEDLGIRCHIALQAEAKRSGKKRRPDLIISPVLPNYIFIEADVEQWFELAQVKHLAMTKTVCPSASIPGVMRFLTASQAKYAERMAKIQAGERLEEFQPNDLIKIISGPLEGQLARFKRIVEESGDDMFPMVEGEFEMMGQVVTSRFDTLTVKKVG